MNKLRKYIMALTLAVVLLGCSGPEGNYTGSEYMPDMAHSIALEANANNYYYYNTWDERSTIPLRELQKPRVPVKNTVPRGFANDKQATMASNDGVFIRAKGYTVYHYADSPEGRLAAIDELIDNPFPITAEGLAKGKMLYNTFCGICHGEKGNGLGYIYDEEANPNAKYPLAPANFLTDQFYEASNGRYYHAIHYGYNAMGAYKDKMNWEERWQVIHYIRTLQAAEKGLEYSDLANTLNPLFGTPAADFDPMAMKRLTEENMINSGMMAEDAAAGEPVSDDPDGTSTTTVINKK